ncbi:hypothetical protein JB92DRAFT_1537551 [Gautieria morchelliformis]|nr:hypothetical protein JB92DRAFT_1537551 [Gautieria morchelliformis]
MLRAKSNFTNGIRLAGLACDTTVSNDPIDKTIIDDQQIKLDALALDSAITTDRLSEYMILYKDMKAKYFHAESKFNELERSKSLEQTKLLEELSGLRAARECYEIEAKGLRAEIELLKRLHQGKESISGEFKPAYRSPEEMMRARFDILGRLPIPSDMPLGVLRPVGIPERFTLHEFLLGSASGSLKSAILCLYRDYYHVVPRTGRTRVLSYASLQVRYWPTLKRNTSVTVLHLNILCYSECFYNKAGEWYYTGTYTSLRLEDLTPKEFDNLSQETRDALVKETLAGRKNVTPQIIFETSQLYAVGALKVAVVGIRCIGFNRMLYSVALQQAHRFQSHGRGKVALTKGAS